MAEVSTKPYLVRAIYEWCADSGYRPFIAVVVDERTQVPREFVRNGEIVLNISAAATNRLHIGNEFVEFEARFSGVARHVSIPIDNVSAIFAQETGHGMAFEVPARATGGAEAHETETGAKGGEAAPAQGAHEAMGLPGEMGEGDASGSTDVGSTCVQATPEAAGGATADESEASASEGRRTGTGRSAKRSRKTVLRDVSAKAPDDEAQKSAESGSDAAAPAARRSRKPAIAAVPRDPNARRERDKGGSSRSGKPSGPDDDPNPPTPAPGKPRLTRVK